MEPAAAIQFLCSGSGRLCIRRTNFFYRKVEICDRNSYRNLPRCFCISQERFDRAQIYSRDSRFCGVVHPVPSADTGGRAICPVTQCASRPSTSANCQLVHQAVWTIHVFNHQSSLACDNCNEVARRNARDAFVVVGREFEVSGRVFVSGAPR